MTEKELLNKVLLQISNSIDVGDSETTDKLSKVYQRIKSVQTPNTNHLLNFIKATKE